MADPTTSDDAQERKRLAASATASDGKQSRGPRKTLQRVTVAIGMLIRADKRLFFIAVTLQMVSALSATGLVVAGKLVLSAISGSSDDVKISRLIFPVALLAITSAMSSSASVLQVQQGRLLGEYVNRDIWRELLDVSSRVDLETFENPEFFNRLSRLANNAVRQPIQLAFGVLTLLGGMVGVIALVVTLAVIQPLLLAPLLLGVGPALSLSRRSGQLEFNFVRVASESYRRRTYFQELLSRREYAKEVRAFALSQPLGEYHLDASTRYLGLLRPHVRKRQKYVLATVLTTGVLLAVGMLVLVLLLRYGWLTFAEAGAAALAIRMLSTQLSSLFVATNTIAETSIFVADLRKFIEETPVEPARAGNRRPLERALSLFDVHYRYPSADEETLHGVDIEIRPGEIVGLVGENGSGKTTLAKIVAGLYPPTEGTIAWDDQPIEGTGRLDLRASVTVIFQDFVRYQMSVRENVTLGDATRIDTEPRELIDADVLAALNRTGANFVDDMKDGLDTLLSREFTGGTDLSLGQWQRIALARGLFRGGSLVVLDEPTASLDPRSEYEMFSAVRKLLDGRAGLIVSHRYANLHLADRIYVLQDGRVVESGSHEELLLADGVYARLYHLQADAYDVAPQRGA